MLKQAMNSSPTYIHVKYASLFHIVVKSYDLSTTPWCFGNKLFFVYMDPLAMLGIKLNACAQVYRRGRMPWHDGYLTDTTFT